MLSRHEDSLSYANVNVKIGSPSHGQLIDAQPSIDGHLASRNAEIVIRASNYIINKYCPRYDPNLIRRRKKLNKINLKIFSFGTSQIECAKELAKVKLNQTSMGQMCLSKYHNETACEGMNSKYRSADGSCNNLKRSHWGKSNTAYKRLLFPAYKDGI